MQTLHSFTGYGAPFTAFIATWLVLRYLLRSGIVLDYPNARSLHRHPVPRTGGIAILAGALLSALLLQSATTISAWCIALLLLLVSLFDDIRGLPVMLRFAAHFLAAAIFVALLPTTLGAAASIIAVVAIVWVTNLYNFMDGSDGLAGGMALFGFGFYALAALLANDIPMALSNISIALAACAFLRFNFSPARIFMGDSGSIPLGFLAAAFGLLGFEKGLWPLWFPVLVFSPFILDASVTLIRRLLRREKIWQAHREHYYQRAVQMGVGHRNTALAEYAMMISAGAASIWALRQPSSMQLILIFSVMLVYIGLMGFIDIRWKHYCERKTVDE